MGSPCRPVVLAGRVRRGAVEHVDDLLAVRAGEIVFEKGEPGYYKLDTRWNMRVTWTGEYLHSAPWSVGSQGSSNVSHGCVNMAPENAKWMFDNSMIGDVVDFTGSSRVFQPTEGIGVWQYSWAEWQKRSALR